MSVLMKEWGKNKKTQISQKERTLRVSDVECVIVSCVCDVKTCCVMLRVQDLRDALAYTMEGFSSSGQLRRFEAGAMNFAGFFEF